MFRSLLLLSSFIIITGCLPQEKELECKSGFAFDENKRICVKSLSANSETLKIESYFPKDSYIASTADNSITHSITIKNDFDNDYALNWVLISNNGSTSVIGDDLTLELNQSGYSPGDYILSARILDPVTKNVLDSHDWSIEITNGTIPSISQTSVPPFSLTEFVPNNSQIINANIANPSNIIGMSYQWYVNDTPVTGETGFIFGTSQAVSFTFFASSGISYFNGRGDYTATLKVFDTVSNLVYSSSDWNLTVGLKNTAVASYGTSVQFSNTTPDITNTLTLISDLKIINDLNLPGSNDAGIIDGGLLFDTDSDGDLDNIDLCIEVDDVTGLDNSGVFIDFLLNGALLNTSEIQYSAGNPTVCLGRELPNFVRVLDATETDQTIVLSAVVYDKYPGEIGISSHKGFTKVQRYDWNVRLRQQNTPPTLTIIDTNADDTPNDSVTNELYCPPASKSSTSFLDCEVTQGASAPFTVTIRIEDDDWDPASDFNRFKIDFLLNGKLLDGTNELATAATDCVYDFGDIAGIADYTCSIDLTPYDSAGPIDPRRLNYSLTAKVYDRDSPYSSTTQEIESNSVSWQITTLNDNNSAISIVPVDTGPFTESSNVNFSINVTDPDRDSFHIKLFRCNNPGACADNSGANPVCTDSTLMDEKTFISTNDTLTKAVLFNYDIKETAVIDAASATVNYCYIINDISDSDDSSSETSIAADFSPTVNQNNPDPILTESNYSPNVSDSLIAFTGYPITLDPGEITDASTGDGNILRYQWYIMVDDDQSGVFGDNGETFQVIPGATNRVLTWSPGQNIDFLFQTGVMVKIILCAGDDGFTNAGIDKNPEGSATCNGVESSDGDLNKAWDITVFSNMQIPVLGSHSFNDDDGGAGPFEDEEGEIAVWVDPNSTDPVVSYMAYVESGSRNIVIEKSAVYSTGQKAGSYSSTAPIELSQISFPFRPGSAGFAGHVVHDLSITGDPIRKELYIAYNTGTSAGVKNTQIRKLDISNGKLAFTHQGLFDFFDRYGFGGHVAKNNSGGLNATSDKSLVDYRQSNGNENTYLTLLEFTGAAVTTGSNVNFISFHLKDDVIRTFTAGTDYCVSSCADANETASDFTNMINNLGISLFNGISASYIEKTGMVKIIGLEEDEYLTVARIPTPNPLLTRDSTSSIEFLDGFSTFGSSEISITVKSILFAEESGFCRQDTCKDKESAAANFTSFFNASIRSELTNLKAIHKKGTGIVEISGEAISNAMITSNNTSIAVVKRTSIHADGLTQLKFGLLTNTPGDITFYNPIPGEANEVFVYGTDYCIGAGTCTTSSDAAKEFADLINGQTDSKFDHIVAYNDVDTDIVIVSGVRNGEHFIVEENVGNEPNPFIYNPNLNEVYFKAGVNGSNVRIRVGNTSLVQNTSFCTSGCTTAEDSAQDFAFTINNSNDQNLQGIRADYAPGTGRVLLYGIDDGQYINASIGSKKLASITINQVTKEWILPFIDLNNDDKVSIIRGPLDKNLLDQSPEIVKINTIETDGVELSYDYDGGNNILLAVKDNTADKFIHMYELDEFLQIENYRTNVFEETSPGVVQNLKVAMSKEIVNFSYSALVAGTNSDTGGNGNLSAALVKSENEDLRLDDLVLNKDLGNGHDIILALDYFDLKAGVKEDHFIMAALSHPNAPTEFAYYILNIYNNNDSLTINCSFDDEDDKNSDNCMQIRAVSASAPNGIFDLKPALGDVITNVKIGSHGAIEDENINDIIPLAYNVDDGGGVKNADAVPALGLINISPTNLTTSALSNTGELAIIPYSPTVNGNITYSIDGGADISRSVDECKSYQNSNGLKSLMIKSKTNDSAQTDEVIISIPNYLGKFAYEYDEINSKSEVSVHVFPGKYSTSSTDTFCGVTIESDSNGLIEGRFNCKKLTDSQMDEIEIEGSFNCLDE